MYVYRAVSLYWQKFHQVSVVEKVTGGLQLNPQSTEDIKQWTELNYTVNTAGRGS